VALPGDLLARPEATDSSLVWGPQAPTWPQRAGAPQQRQVWPTQQWAQEKLRVVPPPARLLLASRRQELAALLQGQLASLAVWPA